MPKRWVISNHWKLFRTLIKLSNKIGEASPEEASLLIRVYEECEQVFYKFICNKLQMPVISGTYYREMKYKKQTYYFKVSFLAFHRTCEILWAKEPWVGDLN